MDLAFAYLIVLLFFGAAGAFLFGAIGPGIGLFLASFGLLFLTQG